MRIPLRLRLTMAFAAGMAVVLAALGVFLYARVGQDLLNGIDMELRGRAQVILGAVLEGGPTRIPASHGELIDPDEAFAQVLTPSARILESSPAVARAPMLDAGVLATATTPTFVSAQVRGVDDRARLLAVPIQTGSAKAFVVVGATLGDRSDALSRLVLALVVGGPVALALVSLAGWLVAGAALRPVERMRREATAISALEPSRRLPVPETGDELARLGATLNSMLDRLHGSLEREQRFLDEASHELRTPLGVLRMELDLALERARTPEELQAALRNASSETDRLVRLAEDLLVLSRTRDGSVPLHRQDVSVCELLEGTAAARSRTGGRTVRVRCEHGLVARLDPDRIRQAVDNLVDNALRHGGDAASVTMSASRAGDTLRISVSDSGPGFSPEVMARGDRGFARDGDGPDGDRTGLGLAIVAAIARSHGGRLVLANANGGGAAVATLDLPMS